MISGASVTNLDEVFWGIVSAFLAFLLGLGWRRAVQFVVNHRARAFWRPFITGRMSVVLGRFRGLNGFEASGVVGAGDNLALKDLADHFAAIGFKRFTVYYNDQLGWSDVVEESPLRGNLILLGGPDANSLTREVLERLTLGIEFLEVSAGGWERIRQGGVSVGSVAAPPRRWSMMTGTAARWWVREESQWRGPVVYDPSADRVYGPVVRAGVIQSDCGIVIRCANPFNPASEVMIFCGSYGYGTWAAVQFARSKAFLERVPKHSGGIECVLTIDVLRDMPGLPTVEIMRPIGKQDPTTRVVVPRILD